MASIYQTLVTVGGEKPEQPFEIVTESKDIPKLSDPPRPSLSAPVKSFNPDPIYPLYRAIFDYSSENDEDLKFRKGDFLYIMNRDEGDWWYAKAKHTGREGYVPKNYIKKPRTPKQYLDISTKYDLSTTKGQEGYIPNNYIAECNSLDTKRYKLHELLYCIHVRLCIYRCMMLGSQC